MKTNTFTWVMAIALAGACAAQQPELPESGDMTNKVIPELNGYKQVRIRSIEPDGVRIMHESGAAKIPIERLTPAQLEAFGLTAEEAAEYRRNLNARAAADQERQQANQRNAAGNAERAQKQNAPRYITPDQIKIYWYKKLPRPRTMDRDFHSAKKAREAFVSEIRAGLHDLAAEKTAVQYNKQEALSFGDHERARLCEAELARIANQEAEQQRREDAQNALEEARRARIQSQAISAQMSRLQSDLNSLNSDIQSIRMSLW